jgi:hypothetical protein
MSTITITFGDQAENHVGMQKLGKLSNEGFNYKELKEAKKKFKNEGYECNLIHLHDFIDIESNKAYVLIVKNGADCLLSNMHANSDDLMMEHEELDWDKKAKMRGRVVNKRARHNLCYGDENQEPDYEEGKGRIISFESLPCTNHIRNVLPNYIGTKAENLVAEGNLYFSEKSHIKMHGDFERKKVIAIRLGETMPLHYQWFYQKLPIGKRVELSLDHGDLYIMSEYATGFNWKRRIVPTLRHAAGAEKYLKLKK